MNALIKVKILFHKLCPKGMLKFSLQLLKVQYDKCAFSYAHFYDFKPTVYIICTTTVFRRVKHNLCTITEIKNTCCRIKL